ncbi:protein kinase [Streptomyces netropsis]|uniref:serine/threonine-protein kinase n=1 Tax=Streptomyces netropsis TaxID=55404 RepID=UPI0030D02DDB
MRPLRTDDPREVAGYRLLARIGEGGMGSVFLSRTRGNQPVALKVIRRELADEEEYRLRFQQEVRAARQVRGYHVVPVVDHDTTGARPWLAGTYIPGLPLSTVIETFGPLPPLVVLHLVGCVAEALRAVHAAGIVHRDLKPSNILLGSEGPWVIDFGIARAADSTQLTRSGGVVGTPQYMSPEQVAGLPLTPAADLFSLGLVAAVAGTGHHPFGEGQATTLAHRIGNTVSHPPDLSRYPRELRPILDRCLDGDPEQRPGPAELAALCEQACGRKLRDFDGWLPAPVAAETALREQAVGALPDTPLVSAGASARAEDDGAAPGRDTFGPDGPTLPPHAGGFPGQGSGSVASHPRTGTGSGPGAGLPSRDVAAVPGPATGPTPAPGSRRRRTPLLAALALIAVSGLSACLYWWPDGDDTSPSARKPVTGVTAPTTSLSRSPSPGASPALSPSAAALASPSAGATAGAGGAPGAPVFSGRQLMLRPPSSGYLFVDLDTPQSSTDTVNSTSAELKYENQEGSELFQKMHFATTTGVSAGTTYEQCLAGAQTNVLPSDVPKKDLIDHTTLRKGMVLCTITAEHNLAMIEIKDIADQNGLPAFDTLLTLWRYPG